MMLKQLTVFIVFLFVQNINRPVIDITIPSEVKKITLSEYKAKKAKFRYNEVPLDFKNLYQYGDILIGIEWAKYPLSYPITLTRLKSLGAALLHEQEIMLFNQVITVNHLPVLVRKSHRGEEYQYRFYSDFKQNRNLSMVMEFRKKDQVKAEMLFKQLLHSIRWNH